MNSQLNELNKKMCLCTKMPNHTDTISLLKKEQNARLICDDYTANYFEVVIKWLEAKTNFTRFNHAN